MNEDEILTLSADMRKMLAQTLVQHEKSAGTPYWDRFEDVKIKRDDPNYVWTHSGGNTYINGVRQGYVIQDETYEFNRAVAQAIERDTERSEKYRREIERIRKTPDSGMLLDGAVFHAENPSHRENLLPRQVSWRGCGHRFLMLDGIHPLDHEHFCPTCFPELRTCNVHFEKCERFF